MNGNFWRAQNKTSRTQLSPRTFADQPSPKCCSIANVFPISSPVNGSSVPWMARGVHELLLDILAVGLSLFRPPCDRAIKSQSPPCRTKRNKYGASIISGGSSSPWTLSRLFARKTKRPRLDLSLGTSVDQPSPKCCSIANVFLTPSPVNGSSVLDMARTGSMDKRMKVRGLDCGFGLRVPD